MNRTDTRGAVPGRGRRSLLRVGLVLVLTGMTACTSFAPTAWIGKDTPEEVGKGGFPKLSDIPKKPKMTESAKDREKIAAGLAADRDRVEREAQILLEEADPTGDVEVKEAP